MSDARSNWSSKTGMILAATGSAVGLGAIWKFPYMAGANGGSACIIPFILMVLFFGVTLILAEIIIGRAGRGSSVTSFRRIGGKFWAPLGFVGVLCAFLIMTYYSTVGGWCLTYLFEAIMGNAASSDLAMLEKTFLKTVSTPVSAILYQTLFLAITAVFSHIPLGDVFAVCFYGCLLVAALTSMISLFEVPLAYLMDEFHFSRKTASVLLFIVLSICSIPSALSMGPWADYKIMDKNIFDAIDFLCCNILMPLSALFVVAMTGWFFFDRTKYEINSSVKHSDGFMKFFRFMLAFVAPCFIVVVAIFNLI